MILGSSSHGREKKDPYAVECLQKRLPGWFLYLCRRWQPRQQVMAKLLEMSQHGQFEPQNSDRIMIHEYSW